MKNQKGFFSLHAIFFLTLLTSAALSYGYISYAQKQKDLFRKVCYYDLADIQRLLIQSEKKLFSLNPESTALRLRLKILYLELAAAIAAQNAPAVAKINLEIKTTMQAQISLDKIQKALILEAQYFLRSKLAAMASELQIQQQHENALWQIFLLEQRKYHLKLNPKLAIQPDSIGGSAPNYELQIEYDTIQQLNLTLHSRFSNNSRNQIHFKTEKSFEHTCTVSFQKKENLWMLTINQDKPSLKH